MKQILTFLFILCLLFPLQANAGADPTRTIEDIQTALDKADQNLFENSVDMESLIGQCLDVLMEDANKEGQQTIPPVLALILSAANMSEDAKKALRSTLINEVSEFVTYGVRSGAFGGKQVDAAPPGGMLAPFLADASMGRKEISHIGAPVEESGAVYVTFALKDYENGKTYPIEAWLRPTGGNWQVIGLRNVRTLLRMIQEESSQTL